MGLRSPERVGKMSETSENVGGGLNEIWYMTFSLLMFFFFWHAKISITEIKLKI